MQHHREVTNFIWRVADILRGHYKQSEYGKVILPLTVLRRLDSVMAETRSEAAAEIEKFEDKLSEERLIGIVERISGLGFFNKTRLDFEALVADPDNVAQNLRSYIAGFSENVRAIFDRFQFDPQIGKLDRSNILFQVIRDFANIDLHQDRIDNTQMGYLYEELIRRFSEQSNETAGEHFTPREVIRMMVAVLFEPDTDVLTAPQLARTVYDPACGTGGMLSVAENYATDLNRSLRFEAYGQELNAESWATCVSDMLMKGQNPDHIVFGNTFTHDGLPGERFHYMLCNPPFGVDWKAYRSEIEDEAEQGLAGRFHAGTPRVSDGSLLFLQHMISKMRPPGEGGSRIAIVFNASPLFTGQAGSGESEIRRWLIESDYLEAIIGFPDQLFYNTGISTYVWILTNRKEDRRKGKIQLIDARDLYQKMRKSLGDKRHELSDDNIREIVEAYSGFETDGTRSKVFDNDHFGFHRIAVERPLRRRWEVNDETLERLEAETRFQKLVENNKPEKQEEAHQIRAIIASLRGRSLHEFAELWDEVKPMLKDAGLSATKTRQSLFMDVVGIPDPEAPPVLDGNGEPIPDSDLRDNEHVPLIEGISEYMEQEVLPHVPHAWVDETKTKIGYEIPFTKEFHVYQPPRPLEEIDADIEKVEGEILSLIQEVTG